MQLTIRGKQMDVGDALRTHVQDSLTVVATKYFNDPIEANVVFSRDAHLFRCDMTIHVAKGILMQANAEATEPYPSFDIAVEKLGKRLRRHKRRLSDHHLHNGHDTAIAARYNVIEAPAEVADDEVDQAESQDGAPVIVADMTTRIETLSVSDAVMRLDLGNLPALMFRNKAHGGFNVIYRRPDGNIGWVDPAGNAAAAG